MLKKTFLALFSSAVLSLSAQDISYPNLAYEFSQRDIYGSARTQALGGANASLGGNPASVALNPAGLGLYRKSEFSMSMGIQTGVSNSSYSINNNSLGPDLDEGYSRFNIPNLTLIIKIPEDRIQTSKWSKGTIGIGLTRVAHFNSEMRYGGNNSTNNKRNYYTETANNLSYILPGYVDTDGAGNNYFGNELDLAYDTYLLNDIGQNGEDLNGEYYWTFDPNEAAYQQAIVKRRGGIDQLDFSYGTSYDETLFFGLSIGAVFLKQKVENTYSERVEKHIEDYVYTETLESKGRGVNIKAGIMWHALSFLRIGGSFETPTWIWMNEKMHGEMTVNYNNVSLDFPDDTLYLNNQYYAETVINEFDYILRTPSRANVGTTLIFGKSAIITADAEMVWYNQMKLSPKDGEFGNYFDTENAEMGSIYKKALNLRGGAEFRFDHTYLRAGGAYFSDPMKEEYRLVNRGKMNYTGGFGYRDADWYIDFAVVHTRYKNAYKPYTLDSGDEPVVITQNKDWRFVVSTGWTFD